MTSWVRYSVAVYIGLMLAGALIEPSASNRLGLFGRLYPSNPDLEAHLRFPAKLKPVKYRAPSQDQVEKKQTVNISRQALSV